MNACRIIHLDLDGVLADFHRGLVEATGQAPDAFSVDEMWARVAAIPEFFLGLATTAAAHELVAAARALGEVRILTAIPRRTTYPAAEEEKRRWVARHFGDLPVVVVQFARQKADHARSGDILIDDAAENVRRWVKAGGIGIVHADLVQTLAELDQVRPI